MILAERRLSQLGGDRAVAALIKVYGASDPGAYTLVAQAANLRLAGRLWGVAWWNQLVSRAHNEISQSRQQRSTIIRLLGARGSDATKAIPLILRHLADGGKYEAVRALIRIGRPAVPTIQRLAEAERDVVMLRQMVTELARISPGSELAVLHRLQTLLTDPDERIRANSAEIIALFGPSARECEPALRHASRDSWRMVREAAERALRAIGATNAPASGMSP